MNPVLWGAGAVVAAILVLVVADPVAAAVVRWYDRNADDIERATVWLNTAALVALDSWATPRARDRGAHRPPRLPRGRPRRNWRPPRAGYLGGGDDAPASPPPAPTPAPSHLFPTAPYRVLQEV